MESRRYLVLFGYTPVGVGDEWVKFESDDLSEAVEFWKKYPSTTNFEKAWYLYIQDNETGEAVGDYWTDGEKTC